MKIEYSETSKSLTNSFNLLQSVSGLIWADEDAGRHHYKGQTQRLRLHRGQNSLWGSNRSRFWNSDESSCLLKQTDLTGEGSCRLPLSPLMMKMMKTLIWIQICEGKNVYLFTRREKIIMKTENNILLNNNRKTKTKPNFRYKH